VLLGVLVPACPNPTFIVGHVRFVMIATCQIIFLKRPFRMQDKGVILLHYSITKKVILVTRKFI
jgi:hypothetical protein